MATYQHPITGIWLNEIQTREGPVQPIERETARHLMAQGEARWIVAARLGRFPLAFDGSGKKPTRARKSKLGANLKTQDAHKDTRQYDLFFKEILGEDTP